MSVAASLCDPAHDARRLGPLRASGGVSLRFARDDGRTRLVDLEERGGFRAKFPRGGIGAEAVLINTGGGMLGGDRYRFDVAVGAGASATVASQSAERIYRALDAPTTMDVTLHVGAAATLAWLPQETILFDGARLSRRIAAEVAADGRLLMTEAVVFGRAAMGEQVRTGALHDRWSIRRNGQMLLAEAVRLDDDMQAALQRPAIGDGAAAVATLVYVAADAEERREAARAALGAPGGRAAISAWNGLLSARFLAGDMSTLRCDLVRVATCLAGHAMPRVWNG